MYTRLKSYQIIIALLKKYEIKHCVLSAGSRNVPFVHSVEQDSYFKCYSVVDERSAGYFALGLAQQTNEPVVISCTASTASCNYWPPVAEAFYQNVPIIILTSDRNPRMLGQREDQMIDQVGMFDRHVKKSVNLPVVKDEDDFIWCQRLVNEALLEMNHHGTGPVHINIPMYDYCRSFDTLALPDLVRYDRLESGKMEELWKEKIDRLIHCDRILIICGQNSNVSNELNKAVELFFEKHNCVVAVEYMSNMSIDSSINISLCTDERFITKKKFEEIKPDIVISYGGNIVAGLKELLRKASGTFEHWLIQENGDVVDLFKGLTTIFECTPEYFFEYVNSHSETVNNRNYFNKFNEYVESIRYPEFEYSNVYAIKKVVESIPSGSILHLAINNAVRIANICKLSKDVTVYANIGTFGIDGCMSTFFGQAFACDGLAFLIIGDLAYFYDMNSMRINSVKSNSRILLLNNHGGEEFYYNGSWIDKSSDLHTSARHNTKAEGWALETGFKYLSANDKDSFDDAFNKFMNLEMKYPVLLEVFTEMSNDAKVLHDFYDSSRPEDITLKAKHLIKSVIGEKGVNSLKKVIKQ